MLTLSQLFCVPQKYSVGNLVQMILDSVINHCNCSSSSGNIDDVDYRLVLGHCHVFRKDSNMVT